MVVGKMQIGLLGLVLGLLVVAFWLWPNEERAIGRQLAKIEELGSKAATESALEAALKARQLTDLFTDPYRVEVAAHHLAGDLSKQQIREQLLVIRGLYQRATVRWYDLTIKRQGSKAQVRGTLRLQGQWQDKPMADVQEVAAELTKIDGTWQICAVTLVAVLER